MFPEINFWFFHPLDTLFSPGPTVYNIVFDNITVFDSNSGLAIQQRSGGNIYNVTWSNIVVQTRYTVTLSRLLPAAVRSPFPLPPPFYP